jgi:hypothetical protein
MGLSISRGIPYMTGITIHGNGGPGKGVTVRDDGAGRSVADYSPLTGKTSQEMEGSVADQVHSAGPWLPPCALIPLRFRSGPLRSHHGLVLLTVPVGIDGQDYVAMFPVIA